MSDYVSIYAHIDEKEYEEAIDPSYSYFPVIIKDGAVDEEGEIIDDVSYAKHKYVYGQEMMDYLAKGGETND